jgi:hypothetical protein
VTVVVVGPAQNIDNNYNILYIGCTVTIVVVGPAQNNNYNIYWL